MVWIINIKKIKNIQAVIAGFGLEKPFST